VSDSASWNAGGSDQPLPYGTGTSYLLGTTLLEQGNAHGALPYLAHAYKLAPEVLEIAEAYLDGLLLLGRPNQALAVMDESIARHPEAFDLRRRRAALLADMGQLERALQQVATLRAEHPRDTELMLLEGGLLERTQDWDGALRAYRQTLANQPEQAERIYLLMASVLARAGRQRALDALWQEATAALPASRPLWFGRLRDLVQQDRLQQARQVAAEAQQTTGQEPDVAGPESPPSWYQTLADLLVEKGNVAGAVQVLEERRQRDVLSLPEALTLVRLLLRSERSEDALSLLHQVADRWPQAPLVHFYLGDLLATQGRWAEAEGELRQAVELGPRQPRHLLALLRVLAVEHPRALSARGAAAADDTLKAVRTEIAELAESAAALVADDAAGDHLLLGYVFRGLDRTEQAIDHFRLAAAADSSSKEALLQLALSLDAAGRPEEALRALEQLRADRPLDADVANSLGYFLAERDQQLARAERLVRQALASDPKNGAYLDSLGWVLYRQGRHEEALSSLIEATNALPEDPTILQHLGQALAAAGRPEEAVRVLRQALSVGGDPEVLRPLLEQLAADPDGAESR
jgi:tetratricopeptide (TPR) repeat protein